MDDQLAISREAVAPDRRPALPRIIGLLLLAVLCLTGTARGADEALITIQEKIWGFDGRVQLGQFNPVSFLIDNRTDEPIDAVAALSRMDGLAGRSGGQIARPVFIGPGAQRWVQLYPYISSDDQADWVLTLGEQEFRGQRQPRSTTTVDDSRSDKEPLPAGVILDAPGTMTLRPVTVKHFPESIFPPWTTATVGLHTVFMDHVPDWEEPRQEALMSWLRRGGRLHLLKNSQDAWPRFSGVLADLSQPLDSFPVGCGTVTRHNRQRGDLSESIVRSAIGTVDKGKAPDELSDEDLSVNSNSLATPSLYHTADLSWLDDSWFEAMRQFTQPAHAWWLIFLLSLIYIVAIFPGCWLLGRQKRHFLTVYGAIIGLSVLFSVLFLLIGRRGYGEFTTQHTLAISRIEDATTHTVLEWNALFVTAGDQYTVTGTGQQSLFAIPGLHQQSNAVMTAGNDGQLSVGIPPFSTQTFVSRRQLPLQDWELAVSSSRPTAGGIADLMLHYGPGLVISEDSQIRIQYGRQLYRVRCDPDQRQLKQTGRIGPLARFCEDYYKNHYDTFGWGHYSDDTADDFYDGLLPAVILRSLADDGISDPRELNLPPDRVRLYVYTRLPPEQFVETNTTPQKQGRILYVRDVLLRTDQPATTVAEEE